MICCKEGHSHARTVGPGPGGFKGAKRQKARGWPPCVGPLARVYCGDGPNKPADVDGERQLTDLSESPAHHTSYWLPMTSCVYFAMFHVCLSE